MGVTQMTTSMRDHSSVPETNKCYDSMRSQKCTRPKKMQWLRTISMPLLSTKTNSDSYSIR